jgi:D-alanyl-D-alanine dipeptidase
MGSILKSRQPSTKNKRELLRYHGLIDIKKVAPEVIVDIPYATENNFAQAVLYNQNKCLLRKKTAGKVLNAYQKASRHGFSLKIKDGYRPFHVQEKLYEIIQNPNYVAKPERDGERLIRGSKHSRGASVDVVLIDKNEIELEMPSDFDDFSEKAHISYTGSSEIARANMLLLQKIMNESGFKSWPFEWWHFDDEDWDDYEMLDIEIG